MKVILQVHQCVCSLLPALRVVCLFTCRKVGVHNRDLEVHELYGKYKSEPWICNHMTTCCFRRKKVDTEINRRLATEDKGEWYKAGKTNTVICDACMYKNLF